MINKIFPYGDFLYLLQLEEYESNRYAKLLPRFFLRRNFQKRQKLVVTSRIKTTFLLSVLFTLLFFILLSVFTVLFIPVWVLLANILLNPVYNKIKLNIQSKAAKYFSKKFKGRVVAIAGSFGKTTTKNYIYELVKYNYKTQMMPGTINTPTGIANWILKNLSESTEILIVEMDTYFIGEIKRICEITPPDIAILTNVGDQHLERLGSKKNLEIALNEVFKYAKPDAVKIRGMDSSLGYALEVASILKIPKDIVNDSKAALKKPDRRGNLIDMYGFKTIDESYNISETTAKRNLEKAVKMAKREHKKLIVITGGIPELGEENREANVRYGKVLRDSKAEVVLLRTTLHKDVKSTVGKDAKLADSMTHAWEIIQKEYNPKDTLVLMQPELGDNYY
jgi:UDP-N-acetylmuramyl pentapeptide synthase